MTTSPTFDPSVPEPGRPRKEEPVAANQETSPPRPIEVPAADAGHAARKKSTHNLDSDEDLIRSAEQFVDSLNKLASRGGTLRIARDADLELPAVEIPAGSSGGGGNWQIEAEQGGVGRPRLRFRPSRQSFRFPASWAAMFNVRQGAVKFVGIDFVVQLSDDDGPDPGRLAAFGIQERTGLTFTNCTITVAGRPGEAAAIVLHESQPQGKRSDSEPSATPTRVLLEDSFLRSGGDGIVAKAAQLLDFQCRNVAIATDGSLLHAMGSPRIDRSRPSLKLRLERAVARTKGGLAFLESAQDDAELPLTQIDAFSSILSTAGQALFRVDGGQGQMDRSRDRIVWKADKVAYDQITTYRRDQVLQTGVPPVDYSRSDWRTAFEPEDESPLIDSIQFVRAPERWRTACSLTESDFRVDAQSPAYGRGPDLARIPSPPRAEL